MIVSKNTNYIDVLLMQKMCHPIAVVLFDKSQEPMTPFVEHESALLESALGNPRQAAFGKDLYPTLEDKAAILYYSLIKNHPFKNGNKRTATATFLVFLHINNFWIKNIQENQDFLVSLAERVAKSKGQKNKEGFISEIISFLKNNMYENSHS